MLHIYVYMYMCLYTPVVCEPVSLFSLCTNHPGLSPVLRRPLGPSEEKTPRNDEFAREQKRLLEMYEDEEEGDDMFDSDGDSEEEEEVG